MSDQKQAQNQDCIGCHGTNPHGGGVSFNYKLGTGIGPINVGVDTRTRITASVNTPIGQFSATLKLPTDVTSAPEATPSDYGWEMNGSSRDSMGRKLYY